MFFRVRKVEAVFCPVPCHAVGDLCMWFHEFYSRFIIPVKIALGFIAIFRKGGAEEYPAHRVCLGIVAAEEGFEYGG